MLSPKTNGGKNGVSKKWRKKPPRDAASRSTFAQHDVGTNQFGGPILKKRIYFRKRIFPDGAVTVSCEKKFANIRLFSNMTAVPC
jgi:hypothetical protein